MISDSISLFNPIHVAGVLFSECDLASLFPLPYHFLNPAMWMRMPLFSWITFDLNVRYPHIIFTLRPLSP